MDTSMVKASAVNVEINEQLVKTLLCINEAKRCLQETMNIATNHNFAAAVLVGVNERCLSRIIKDSNSLEIMAQFVSDWLYEMAYPDSKDVIIKECELKEEDLEDYPSDIF